MASYQIYQFRAELKDYRPKIWRRFQVMSNITMADLGYTVMTMYEMMAEHLFCFEMKLKKGAPERRMPKGLIDDSEHVSEIMNSLSDVNGQKTPSELFAELFAPKMWRFEIIHEDFDLGFRLTDKTFDVMESGLGDVMSAPGERITFIYDFGDYWQVELKLEKVIEDDELSDEELPRVLAGKGYGIIEDCGSVWGLAEIAEAFKVKSGEKYEMYREWLGVDDLEAFDIEDMNNELKHRPKEYSDIYEHMVYE